MDAPNSLVSSFPLVLIPIVLVPVSMLLPLFSLRGLIRSEPAIGAGAPIPRRVGLASPAG